MSSVNIVKLSASQEICRGGVEFVAVEEKRNLEIFDETGIEFS